jgi:hypothetical protein
MFAPASVLLDEQIRHSVRVSSIEVGGWVWAVNVPALMRQLATLIGYAYDEFDEDAVEAGLAGTDADQASGWYDYPLIGQPALTVGLAQNVGAEPVSVRVVGDMDPVLAARVDTVISVLAAVRTTP